MNKNNNNNGNRRTSLRIQSKLAKSAKPQTVHNKSSSSSSSASLTTSSQEEHAQSNENNLMNTANQENLKFAMILRSNLILNSSSNNNANSNAVDISSASCSPKAAVAAASASSINRRKSTQDMNRNKIFKLGKNSDKKQRLRPKKSIVTATVTTNNQKRRKNVKKREKRANPWTIASRSSQTTRSQAEDDDEVNEDVQMDENVQSLTRPTASVAIALTAASSSSSLRATEAPEFASITPSTIIIMNTTTADTNTTTAVTTATTTNTNAVPTNNNNNNNTLSTFDLTNTLSMPELKFQLKKATVKFNKACRQLTLLDQHMSDLQNSYSNAVENDRKTFKIVFRMQLATLEGTHNAYIEYIERQVEKIKKLKHLLFSDTNISQHLNSQTH